MTKILDISSAARWVSLTVGDRNFGHDLPDNDNDDPPALPMRMASALPTPGSGLIADGLWH